MYVWYESLVNIIFQEVFPSNILLYSFRLGKYTKTMRSKLQRTSLQCPQNHTLDTYMYLSKFSFSLILLVSQSCSTFEIY
jgi:hypothetical protein